MSYYSRKRVRKSAPALVVEPFTNSIKQVIQPGDDVAVVTTCTGNTKVKRGIYIGTKNGNVSCKVLEPRLSGYTEKATGQFEDYTTHFARRAAEIPHPKYPHLNYREPGYNEAYAEYRKLAEQYQADHKAFSDRFKAVYVDHYRGTTLQQNRIYKLDTSVFDLKL